jgi:hypothetical protein
MFLAESDIALPLIIANASPLEFRLASARIARGDITHELSPLVSEYC